MKCPKCKSANLTVTVIQREPYHIITCNSMTSGSVAFKKLQRFLCNDCYYKWEK